MKRAGAILAACVLASASAHAESAHRPVEVVRFAFRGVQGCPSEEEFVAEVSSRTTHFRLAGPAERARTFFVTVNELPEGTTDRFVGELAVQEEDGRKSQRNVAGADCAQVATALSIVIAIELDPEAAGHEPREVQVAPPVTPPTPPPRVEIVERSPWRVGAVLGGGIIRGMTPTTAGTGELDLELRRESPRLLAPVFRFGFAFSGNASHNDSGSTQLVIFTPVLEACPVQLAVASRRLIFEPCGRFTAGFYYAQGSTPTARGQNQLAVWGSLGVVARAVWFFAKPVFLELDGELFAPLERDRFYLGDVSTSPVYFQAPPAGLRGTIAVGVHFL